MKGTQGIQTVVALILGVAVVFIILVVYGNISGSVEQVFNAGGFVQQIIAELGAGGL